jgi:3-oxoadipate CoA-transferase alpha subunit
MAIDKRYETVEATVADIHDGATLLVGGFGGSGLPTHLLGALAERKLRDLTVISNNAGSGRDALAMLLLAGSVRKIYCSFPRTSGSFVFDELYRENRIELELVPQGTLSERIRAAGAGIAGFYTKTGAGTALAEDREQRTFDGEAHVLELALGADFAFICAAKADPWGNLVYRETARNFGPTMAMAATVTVVEVAEVVALGELDPESVVTPGIFVDRVVRATP